MKISEDGLNLIKEFEGFSATAYLCPAKVWTIGWGSTRFKGQKVAPGMRGTVEELTDQIRLDLEDFESSVEKLVKVKLTQAQFDALVSFTYNLGAGNLKNSTLLKRLNAGNYDGAADEFLKWNRAGGKVLNGLVRRREAERSLFLKG